MCLQCLPFFSKSNDSPPSSPRHAKPSPAEEPPSLKQPLLTSHESFSTPQTALSSEPQSPSVASVPTPQVGALSPHESFSTPHTALSSEPQSPSVASVQTPQVGAPMEAFFTPLTTASQAESEESYAKSPTTDTSIDEPESTPPEVTSLQVPVPGFAFPDALQGVPVAPALGVHDPSSDDPVTKEETSSEDAPKPISLETTQSAPPFDVPLPDENDPKFVPSAVAGTAILESSQSDSAMEVCSLPGFADAHSVIDGPGRHRRHFRKHLQEFQEHFKHGVKQGERLLKEEGTRHFQALMNNMNNTNNTNNTNTINTKK